MTVLMGNSGNNNGVVCNTIKNQIRKFAQKAFTDVFGNELVTFREQDYKVNSFKNFFVKRGAQSSKLLFIKFNCLGQFLMCDGKENNVHWEKCFLTVSRGIPLTLPFLYAAKRFSDSIPQARSMFLSGWFRLARMFSTIRMRSTGESCSIDFSMFLAVIGEIPLSLFSRVNGMRIFQRCTDIGFFERWEVFKNFINAFSGGEHFQNLPNHDTGPFKGRFAVADFRIGNNEFIDL